MSAIVGADMVAPQTSAMPICWRPSSANLAELQVQMVVACGQDRAIGERGTMPWRLSADLRHFKQVTSRTCVIMGRKTLESIGKALPQRRNIVLSSDPSLAKRYAKIEVATSLEAALELATQPQKPRPYVSAAMFGEAGMQMAEAVFTYDTVSLIGGSSVFALGMQLASRLVITEIAAKFPYADTFFPEIDRQHWKLVSCQPEPKVVAEVQEPCYYFCADPQPEDFAQERVMGLNLVDENGASIVPERLEHKEPLTTGLAYRYMVYQAR